MKHEKEWHTCDRCGAEIDKMPESKNILRRKIVSPAELKMIYSDKCGYVSDEYMVSENIMAVTIVESQYKNCKSFDLCHKCRKDFERFMENGKSKIEN